MRFTCDIIADWGSELKQGVYFPYSHLSTFDPQFFYHVESKLHSVQWPLAVLFLGKSKPYSLLSSWSLDTILVLHQAAMLEDSMTSHENALLDIQQNAYNNR